MIMKQTLLLFPIALLALALAAGEARAQRLPDSVFSQASQAFGNTLQDVPPDILSVEVSPQAPAADERVWVRAVIQVNPDMSYFRVNRALLYYSIDAQAYTAVDMELVDDAQGLWQASVPGFPAGTEVRLALAGWDEVGNAVIQVPVQKSVSRDALFPVITDPRDQGIPDGLDILEMQYGTDGDTLFYCQNLAGAFQSFTILGASANAMGIVNEDVRIVQHRSYSENNCPYLAYAPQFEIAGIVDINDVLKGRKIPEVPGVSVSAKGSRLCARAPVDKVAADRAHGVKVFSATVALNPGTEEVVLADASPYAILYFGGLSYTVK